MHLATQAIVLVLTGELFAVKACQDVLQAAGGFGQHGFAWNAQRKLTLIIDLVVITLDLHKLSQHFLFVWVLGNCFFNTKLILNEVLFSLLLVWEQLLK